MQQRAGLAMMAWMVLLALPWLTLAEQDCMLSIPLSPLHSTPRANVTLPCHARSPHCTLQMITWSRLISIEEAETIVTCNGSLCEVTASGYQGRVRLATSQSHNSSLILTDVRLNDTTRYNCVHQWRLGDVFQKSTIAVDLNVTEQGTTISTQVTEAGQEERKSDEGRGSRSKVGAVEPEQETNTAAHVPMWYYMPAVVLVVVMAVGLPLLYHFTCKKKSVAVLLYPSTSLDGRTEPRAMQNDAAGEVFYETVNMGDEEPRDSMAGEEPHIHGSPLPVIYSTVNEVSSGPNS
ncbi:uncharacterized protein LOC116957369 [Petromyzon marinus]|uniref:Hyaluronan and Proteoglycan Link Protein B n=1 Tax=Petromyzon marinus TaxID=7757 RepID=A0A894J6A8_PETMA|nr:uncharacterized protein LOC116957369 isoform X2 [Petromyzon marinus]QRV07507.1 Hyaluronan and Proteoglycan Link Protein B [Petromyzon marinus]